MLVLSRKATETIYLGDEIVLTVLSMKGSRVQLGINAPASVLIRRAELEWQRESDGTEVLVPPPVVCRPR